MTMLIPITMLNKMYINVTSCVVDWRLSWKKVYRCVHFVLWVRIYWNKKSQVDTFVVPLSKHFVIIILPFMVTVVGLLISFHHAYGNHTRGVISLFEFNCIV